MNKLIMYRHWNDKKQTTGVLMVINKKGQPIYSQVYVERGELGNKKNVSRVPEGTYDLVFEYSPKFKCKLWELKGVLNRSECKIHPANFWYQLHGCVSPGMRLGDINKDGYFDVLESRQATILLHKVLEGMDKTTITIVDVTKK